MILRRVSTVIALGLLVGGCESLPQVFDLSDEEVKKTAKEITVIIDDCGSAGSGVIFKKDGNTYSVLTADHVVKKAKGNCVILKSDNSQYKASVSEAIVPVAGVDLAVLTFQSDKNHKLAKWGDSDKATDYTKVYVAGAPEPTQAILNRIIRVEDGKIENRKLQTNGYDLIYTNKTLRGMSGGPVLNQKGEVIGIHGQGDQDNGIKTGLNLGIPIKTFLKSDFAPKIDEDSSRLRVIIAFVIIIAMTSILGIFFKKIFISIYYYNLISIYYYNRGLAKYNLGRNQEAIADYDRAIQLNPNDAAAYFNRAYAKYALGKKEEAIADYDRAIWLDSNNAIAYNNRGLAKYALGKKEEAIADYDRAIGLDSNNTAAYVGRGLAKSDLGRNQEAIADYDRAIGLDSNNANAYYGRGTVKSTLNDKQSAIQDYQKAADLYKQQGDTGIWYQQAVDNVKKLSEP